MIHLDKLFLGDEVKIFFALNSLEVKLKRRNRGMDYNLHHIGSYLKSDITKSIPFNVFLQEWLHCLCRFARIMDVLGNKERQLLLDLNDKFEQDRFKILNIPQLKDALEKPLEEVIRDYSCE